MCPMTLVACVGLLLYNADLRNIRDRKPAMAAEWKSEVLEVNGLGFAKCQRCAASRGDRDRKLAYNG